MGPSTHRLCWPPRPTWMPVSEVRPVPSVDMGSTRCGPSGVREGLPPVWGRGRVLDTHPGGASPTRPPGIRSLRCRCRPYPEGPARCTVPARDSLHRHLRNEQHRIVELGSGIRTVLNDDATAMMATLRLDPRAQPLRKATTRSLWQLSWYHLASHTWTPSSWNLFTASHRRKSTIWNTVTPTC